jgi:hypothetical protein
LALVKYKNKKGISLGPGPFTVAPFSSTSTFTKLKITSCANPPLDIKKVNGDSLEMRTELHTQQLNYTTDNQDEIQPRHQNQEKKKKNSLNECVNIRW